MYRASLGYGLSKVLAKEGMKSWASDIGLEATEELVLKLKPQEVMSWATQAVLTEWGQRAVLCQPFPLVLCQQLQAIESSVI